MNIIVKLVKTSDLQHQNVIVQFTSLTMDFLHNVKLVNLNVILVSKMLITVSIVMNLESKIHQAVHVHLNTLKSVENV